MALTHTAGLAPVRRIAVLVGVALATLQPSCTDEIPFELPQTRDLRVHPDSTDLRLGRTVRVEALPLDERGNLVAGRVVAWSSDAPGVALVDDDGVVQATGVGTATIRAEVDGFVATARVRVQADPTVALSQTTVDFAKAADAPNPEPVQVGITNSGGFELSGLAVDSIAYVGSAAGWLAATLDTTVAPATLEVAVVGEPPTEAGVYQAIVTISAFDAANSPAEIAVTLEVDAGAAAVVEASGDGQTAVAGAAVATAPSIRLTDAFDNPVAGVAVTFAAGARGGAVTGADPVTDDDGRAAVGSWTLGDSVGEYTLTATIAADGIAPVVFTATAVPGAAAALEAVAGDGQSATVNSAVPTAPSVRVTDALGNAVAGVGVTFVVTGGGGSVIGGAATTDSAGIATVGGWTLGTIAGDNELTATVSGVADTVRFGARGTAAAAATVLRHAGNAQSATVGSAVGVRPAVRVTDVHGNAVAGFAVTFTVTGGGGSVVGGSQATDSAGIASVGGWTLGTVAGTNTLQAVAAGLTGSPIPFTATGVADDPAQVALFAGDGQTAFTGSAVATQPAVRVTDQHGNAVADVVVRWEVTGGGGSVTDDSTLTGSDGVARVAGWVLGSTAGENALEATVEAPGVAGNPVAFSATGVVDPNEPAHPDSSTVEVMPASIDASTGGSVATVTVTARDRFGNPKPGATVTLEVEPDAGVTVTQPPVTTDSLGVAVGSFHATSAGAKTVSARAGAVALADSVIVDVAPGPPSTAHSTVEASAGSITASGGASSSVVTVTVHDEFGNALAGVEVTPSSSGSANVFEPASALTGDDGSASFDFHSTRAQVKTIAATLAGVGVAADTAIVVVQPAALSLDSSLVAATSPIAASAGSSVSTVTVTARDVFGNARAGEVVTIAVSGTGNTVTQPAASTNANGQATGSFHTTVAEPKTVSASIAGAGTLSQIAEVVVEAAGGGTPASIELVQGDGQSAIVGTEVPVLPTVRVADEFDNSLLGVEVTFEVTSGGGSATGTSTSSASGGLASVGSWTLGETVGTNTLVARVAGLADSVVFTATGTADAPALAVLHAGDDQAATVGTAVAVAPAVRVTDQYGNPIEGFAVDFEITSGGGQLDGAGTTTDADGVAAVLAWTLDTIAGANAMRAVATGLAGSPVLFSATGTPDSPDSVAKIAGDNQTAFTGSAVPTRPAVQVVDRYGNDVPGVLVTWQVTSGGGSATGDSTVTDADGVARVGSWTLGNVAGTNTLVATVDAAGVTGNPATFTATGEVDAGSAVPDADMSSVTATSAIEASAGSSVATVTIVVRDEFGNPLPGMSVTFAVDPASGVTAQQPATTTDAAGTATGSFYSTAAGTKTVSATVNGSVVIAETADVEVAPAEVSTAVSTIVSSADTITASDDGTSDAVVTVTVVDDFGNGIAGIEVTPASSGTSNVFDPVSAISDANGVAQFSFRSTQAASKSISAALTGFGTLSQTATIVVEAAAPSVATSQLSATGPLTASTGSSASTVTVTVRDEFGNARPGATVTLAVSGSGNTVTQPGSVTNAAGQATGSFYSTGAATKVVSASITGFGTIVDTAHVVVSPAAASLTNSLVSATSPITASNTGSTAATRSTVTVTVRDEFGNARSGHTVTLAVSGTGNTITQPSTTTNASGQTTGSFYSTVAAAKTVTASITGVGAITQTPSVTVNAAAPASVTVTNHGFSARVTSALGTRPTFTVRDAFNNPVPNTAVSYSSSGGVVFAGPSTTNASGQATLTSWTMGGTAADDALGRMPNTVTLTAGSAQGTATNYGIYTWSGDVNALVGQGSTCDGCHGFRRNPDNIVGDLGTLGVACDASTRVVAGNANSSILYNKLTTSPSCGAQMFFNHGTASQRSFTADELKRVRAWINNGALDN